VKNAIKFSPPGGVVQINLYDQGESVKIDIADRGIGMTDQEIQRIFERFYKGDKSRSYEGNGLGLVIVKKIVEQSNGRITVDSRYGLGSTFTVELPK
jgi:signal transduction histidine kinase